MENPIYLISYEGSEFTTFCFYNSFLPLLHEHYKKCSDAPTISFQKLDRINALVLPNLVGIGYYLREYHNKPIELLLDYNPNLLYYLEKTGFFNICGKKTDINSKGLNIYNFDDRFIGGFSGYIEKEQRKEHKLHSYFPIENSNDTTELHDKLLEELTLFTLPKHFKTVLSDTISINYINKCIECIAEPISNGILHSKSITWAISQTTPKPYSKTLLSIVDVGIGFEKSLKKNKSKSYFLNKIKEIGDFKDSLNDFYYIMEALHISLIKNRSGLIDFIFEVAFSGTVRIHYNSTQILFTPRIIRESSRLFELRGMIISEMDENQIISEQSIKKATEEIFNLSKLLLRLRSNDKKFSSVRIYDVIFKGVHIEFELPKSEKL